MPRKASPFSCIVAICVLECCPTVASWCMLRCQCDAGCLKSNLARRFAVSVTHLHPLALPLVKDSPYE